MTTAFTTMQPCVNDTLAGNTSSLCATTMGIRRRPPANSADETFYIVTTIIVGIGMIGVGASVHYKVVLYYLRHPKGFILGVLLQLLVLPPLAWAFARIFSMPFGEALGVFIQGASPGGNTSNIVVYWIGGIVDLSVAMTVTTTLLALGTTTMWLYIYNAVEPNLNILIPYDRVAIALAVLIAPLLIGMVIRVQVEKKAPIISRVLIVIASIGVLVLLIVRGVLSTVPWIPSWRQAVVAALMPVVAYVLGYLVALIPQLGLKSRSRKTIAIETAMQNAQIAVAVIELTGSRLRNPLLLIQMLLFPIFYYVFQVAYSVIFIIAYTIAKRKGYVEENEEVNVVDIRSKKEIEKDKMEMQADPSSISPEVPSKGKENPSFVSEKH